MRATAAFTRSWMMAFLTVLVAVLSSRPDVLLLSIPFVVHLGWSLVTRPRVVPEVVSNASSVLAEEGESIAHRLTAEGWTGYLACQVGLDRALVTDPPSGVLVGAGPEATISIQPERWGRYALDVDPIVATDTTGSWRATVPGRRLQLTVRPHVEHLAGGSGVAQPIGMSGIHRSRHRGEGAELSDVREFASGDRLRRINWRVTSRLPGVFVNSMLVERDTDVLVVADTLLDVGIEGEDSSLDALVRAITALTQHYCGFGDRVAIHDLGRRIGPVRPGTGNRQVRTVVHRLARAQRAGANEVEVRRVRGLASGTLVFFCSPLLDATVVAELVQLRRRGGEVVAIDTMPERVGTDLDAFARDTRLGEAWWLRRLEREEPIAQLREFGIPVVAWRGPRSLAAILRAMEAARSAPRMCR